MSVPTNAGGGNDRGGLAIDRLASTSHRGLMPRLGAATATRAALAILGYGGDATIVANAPPPAFPGCVVFNSAQIIVATGTVTVLTYDGEEFDTAGFHSTSVNPGRLTIPAGLAGLYLPFASAQWDAQAGGGRRVVGFRKNGAAFLGSMEAAPNGTATFPTFTPLRPVRMAAGDYFESYGFHDKGANLGIVFSSGNSPIFGCIRLGD